MQVMSDFELNRLCLDERVCLFVKKITVPGETYISQKIFKVSLCVTVSDTVIFKNFFFYYQEVKRIWVTSWADYGKWKVYLFRFCFAKYEKKGENVILKALFYKTWLNRMVHITLIAMILFMVFKWEIYADKFLQSIVYKSLGII